ncbi:MAG: formate--tetrahydrofolate ligase, partial [Nitrospinaceae bacterium]|nr:formate--tetrahydrofolate ligase [Nitrospinaceae bacterium]NIR55561.1 formate--tetrahydrofolate ligase [Nitrospinaceae bacterium]NIS85995.1 formate--tetrahydrofolate ligase [Nitrospinaceae bacterium]NIT82841.1 formate--tetrahydrofolate ligase [Nitrospinaceae bacterium]NIU45043.1 formate--tetrahydrofolate ligase [Nitrospinaceae bacterium]
VPSPFHPLYDWSEDVETKIWKVAHEMYGAEKIVYAKKAERDLKSIYSLGYDNLPVCVAKTQASLTDDPKIYGRP